MTPGGPDLSSVRGLRRVAALIVLAVALAAGILAAREYSIGRDAAAAAEAAASRSDWRESIAKAREAAEALAPGSPWPERGLRRLEEIGRDSEARGDEAIALLAYGAMRTASLETRAPGTWSNRWRQEAEDGLVRVAAASRDAPRPRPAAVLDALRAEEPPSPWRLGLLALSSLGTLSALAALAWSDGPPRLERTAKGVAATGFVVFALVLWFS